MDKINLNIWGREVSINIIYDCFDDEKITIQQTETYNQFIQLKDKILEQAYLKLEDYCKTNYPDDLGEGFDNIFKYIKPKQLYIKRSTSGNKIAGLLCDFKFDMEHGLAVYIENGVVTKVGPQDIIL